MDSKQQVVKFESLQAHQMNERPRGEQTLPGLKFAIEEVEAMKRNAKACGYNDAYLAAFDHILLVLINDLVRGGHPSTAELM